MGIYDGQTSIESFSLFSGERPLTRIPYHSSYCSFLQSTPYNSALLFFSAERLHRWCGLRSPGSIPVLRRYLSNPSDSYGLQKWPPWRQHAPRRFLPEMGLVLETCAACCPRQTLSHAQAHERPQEGCLRDPASLELTASRTPLLVTHSIQLYVLETACLHARVTLTLRHPTVHIGAVVARYGCYGHCWCLRVTDFPTVSTLWTSISCSAASRCLSKCHRFSKRITLSPFCSNWSTVFPL